MTSLDHLAALLQAIDGVRVSFLWRDGQLLDLAIERPLGAVQAEPLPLKPLSLIQRAVLSACTAEPLSAKIIARKAERSPGRVREAIAQLVADGLLVRVPRGIRLPVPGGRP